MDPRFSFLREQPSSHARPVQTSFHHAVPTCEGEVAVHYWPAARGTRLPPERIVLFVLGNPGIVDYYIPFLSHLHYLLSPHTAVLSTSHIGHAPALSAPAAPLHLLQHLETKVELVKGLRRALDVWSAEARRASRGAYVPDCKMVLVGHSVGAWMMLETMKRLEGFVEGGYMLFPTVGWIANSWNGRVLKPIFHPPLRHILPYLSTLLRPILPLTTFPAPTLSLLRSPRTIAHALHMAHTEMTTIRSPDLRSIHVLAHGHARAESSSASSSRGLGGGSAGRGLHGIWSGGSVDGWVGEEGALVREVMGGEEGGRVVVVDGVPHAFCLSKHHSQLVADIVAGWIDPDKMMADNHSESDASDIISSIPM